MFPGFVDIQVNGYKGVSFNRDDLTAESISSVGQWLGERGTVGYCPTLPTCSEANYRRNLPLLAEAMRLRSGSQILGIHIEGPFISPEDGPRGVHSLASVSAPSIERFDRWMGLADGAIAMLTLAPEVDGAMELIEHATAAGVTVSLGHTTADAETIRRAIDRGAKSGTHIGNGLADTIHRHLNPIWPMLADDRLMGMFIPDGFHLPLDMLRVCLRAKGVERSVATSDMACQAGLPAGEYQSGGNTVVLEENGHLHKKGAYQLAGATSDLLDCMNVLASLGELDEAGLRAVGYENPLRLIGGSVAPDRLAAAPKVSFDGERFCIAEA